MNFCAPVLKNGFPFAIPENVPAWDGSTMATSGPWHYPAATNSGGMVRGNGTAYPMKFVTLAEAAHWYWVVRKVQFSGTILYQGSAMISGFYLERNPGGGERSLIFGVQTEYRDANGNNPSVGYDRLVTDLVKGDDGFFYGRFNLGPPYGGYGSFGTALWSISSSPPIPTSATATINGQPIPFYTTGYNGSGFTGNLTAEIVGAFTYGGRFDATTGAAAS